MYGQLSLKGTTEDAVPRCGPYLSLRNPTKPLAISIKFLYLDTWPTILAIWQSLAQIGVGFPGIARGFGSFVDPTTPSCPRELSRARSPQGLHETHLSKSVSKHATEYTGGKSVAREG